MPISSSMPAIASLSASVKSTPLVCAPSRSVVSNRYRRSRDIFLPLSQTHHNVERQQRRGGHDRVFQDDVILPVARERCFWRFGHEASGLATSGLCIVVLASHSSPTEIELRC